MSKIHVGIVGSRDFCKACHEYGKRRISKERRDEIHEENGCNLDLVYEFVRDRLDPEKHVIVSGGASGVDRVAEKAARDLGFEVKIFKAKWSIFGRSAGFKRNTTIVEVSHWIVAFWTGVSNGTKDTINKAHKNEVPVNIYIRH